MVFYEHTRASKILFFYSECGGLLYGNEGVVSRPLAPNYANEGNSYCKWTLQQEQAGTGFNVSKQINK